jgi:3-methylcrotonyl-CoA carboxylase alpha subunit
MGGGGKGMKICHTDSEFKENLPSAQREAIKSFKDERVLIEKYIVNPKHIEVQVFGDDHGNYVHLFERDCSIQRRHQKVIEEAPSALGEELRQEICNAAVEAARAVNYVNAGTVEFIFDLDTNKYYFMEMNTRLQVEHPISEMITGQDFVEWQLLVAKGHQLPLLQKDIRRNGHAIEARIYSEDPQKFLPGRGTVKYYSAPTENVRIDSGVQLGSEVGIFYDPMISKLIVHGETRELAVQKMTQALKNYKVGGLVTNIPLLSRIMKTGDFRKYDYDLKFIEKHMDPDFQGENLLMRHHWGYSDLQSLALLLFNQKVNDPTPGMSVPAEFANLRINSRFSKTTQVKVTWAYSYTEDVLDLETTVTQKGTNLYDINVKILNQEPNSLFANTENEFSYENVNIVGGNGQNSISIDNGKELFSREYFWSDNNLYLFNEDGSCFEIVNVSDRLEVFGEEITGNEANIKSNMPGVVVKVNVKPGDAVKKVIFIVDNQRAMSV